MSYHQNLLRKANKAIESVFADTSVPAETTLESLYELQDEIGVRIQGLESEAQNADTA